MPLGRLWATLVTWCPRGAGSDVLLPSTRWTSCVVGKTSPWLRLDSDDTKLRRTSEVAFKVRRCERVRPAAKAARKPSPPPVVPLQREAAWASHLGVPALLVSAPPAVWQHSNLARCVNQLLSAANFADVCRRRSAPVPGTAPQ